MCTTTLCCTQVTPDGLGLTWFEHRWNKIANIIFLESPACVGYSYNDFDNCTSSDDQVSSRSNTYTNSHDEVAYVHYGLTTGNLHALRLHEVTYVHYDFPLDGTFLQKTA